VILSKPISYESAPVGGSSRPTVVTVLAIIAIVLGALGVACKPTNVLFYFVSFGAGNPVLDKMKADNAMFMYSLAAVSVSWLMSIVLLACGIGMLSLREWSRQGLIAWSALTIVIDFITQIVNWVWVMPRMKGYTGNTPNPYGGLTQAMGVLVYLLFSVALPIVVIYLLSRPPIKEAFARGLKPII
jgi:hypothetical protein